jgi:pyroglutamyl-peptidase
MMRILLTCFEPFGGLTLNSSLEVGREVARRPHPPGAEVRWFVLPVAARECARWAWGQVEASGPEVVVCLGQATGAQAVRVEERAHNLDHFSMADNAGWVIEERPVIPGGPLELSTTLPNDAIRAALLAESVPTERSLSAGAFICNHLLYSLLHRARAEARPARIGFLHLPLLGEQEVLKEGKPLPTLPREVMVRGVRRALAVCVGRGG